MKEALARFKGLIGGILGPCELKIESFKGAKIQYMCKENDDQN